MYFTHLKVWGFNARHLSGIEIINLPIEEVLFFITIPYACMFTYDLIKIYLKISINVNYLKKITFSIAVALVILSLFNYDKLYTSVTFLLTAIFLLLHLFLFKSDYLGHFYIAYCLIYFFPFLIVNGILTGTMLTEPVVWYNNLENLGIRIFTIPVEDFIYGMLLYLSNITIYEKLLSLKKIKFLN